jgi:hypothetical protein
MNCKFCNKPIPTDKTRNVFCNHSCSASFNNRGIRRHGERRKCLFCNSDTTNAKFCSNSCQRKHEWEKRKELILETGIATDVTARRLLEEQQGRKCQMCGLSEWMKLPILLILDHINGDPEDWSIANLRLICSNCDTLTPTYKGRNKGRGRHSRRIRYQQGKSF